MLVLDLELKMISDDVVFALNSAFNNFQPYNKDIILFLL